VTANDRQEALRNLIRLRTPAVDIAKQLRAFSWDSDEPLVTFTRSDCQHVLDTYLSGDLDEHGVEEWANVVESRDDIGFEAEGETLLKDFVFQMANPVIANPLTHELAIEWKSKLE
jgi:hypothetical protein